MAKEKQIVEVPDFVTVRQLAELIGASPIDVMKELIKNGIMASINQQIDYDTAAIVVEEMGYEARPTHVEEKAPEEEAMPQWRHLYDDQVAEALKPRPPVVTILGHVDHGKTSLLDAIRQTHVTDSEAGGITQHIGAYQVTHEGRKITFLDTPGHEAFTAMRARGAQGADIAVLVVAADDGVMPTTREALSHVRAAHVPVVVALNKIDKANANPDRVKQELAEIGLISDEWDGDTMIVPVSARQKTGMADLLEAILLVADEVSIVANPEAPAAGTVLEGRLDRSRGAVATLLVQNGTLKAGDIVVAGNSYGRIRAMFDEHGKSIKKAGPSQPVSVIGLSEAPAPGDAFEVVESDRRAKLIGQERKAQAAASALHRVARATSLEDFFAQFQQGKAKELFLIVKADVQGSLEPVVNSLNNLDQEEVKLEILHAEVGNITETDVMLAGASKAIILGFNVQIDTPARRMAESQGVDVRLYSVIYNLIEDVEKALKGLLEPVYADVVIGTAEVRQVFKISKVGNIAGCFIRDGEARRNSKARVRRGGEIVFSGGISSLKRFEEDVREVRTGFECGVSLDSFNDFRPGDVIEFFVRERVN